MPYIEVFFKTKQNISQLEKRREILWYDVKKHKMHTFSAARLDFEYQYDHKLGEYRMLPKPVYESDSHVINEIDKDSINNWFNMYSNYNNVTADIESEDENSVTFSVSSDEIEDFVDDLERNGFRFSLD